MCAGIEDGGRISRDNGELVAASLEAPRCAGGPECVRCTYAKGGCVLFEVVTGVPGPIDADRGASLLVGESNELMSIFSLATRYCSLLLHQRQLSNQSSCLPPPPIPLRFHRMSRAGARTSSRDCISALEGSISSIQVRRRYCCYTRARR